MAEILVLNRDSWMDALRSQEIEVHKERYANNYIEWRNAKIALTSAQITKILRPMSVDGRELWTAKHNEVLAMTQIDIDTACEVHRQKFVAKYNSRQRKGDIVEIQEDGFWTVVGRGWDKKNFDLLVISGLKAAEARKKYGGALASNGDVKAKFKCNINLTIDSNQLQAIDKSVIDSAITTKTVI